MLSLMSSLLRLLLLLVAVAVWRRSRESVLYMLERRKSCVIVIAKTKQDVLEKINYYCLNENSFEGSYIQNDGGFGDCCC